MIAHQQHVLHRRRRPALIGVGQKVFDGLRGDHPVAELVIDIGHIHHFHFETLGLSKVRQLFQPIIGLTVFIPAQICVGDQDIVRLVFAAAQITGNIGLNGRRGTGQFLEHSNAPVLKAHLIPLENNTAFELPIWMTIGKYRALLNTQVEDALRGSASPR